MHLRGTHCVRSEGNSQINRAQSRVKIGRADARVGAEADETNCERADSGRVHTTSIERTAVKLFCAASGVVAAGSDCGAEVASLTQQQFVLQQTAVVWLTKPAEVV